MKSIISEPLGLFGWSQLDPIILASLVNEGPLLLIGKHGAAKSFILEKLAQALKLNYRIYNASLINYDDLVGIPVPNDDYSSLRYITNQTSIWDAEAVFIDEINRTKSELQNKLFPIIYDKRIQGQDLDKLRFRWAAMNPSYINEDDEEESDYLGTTPLDPALADRFSYLVSVPSWEDLTESDKKNMLVDQYKGPHKFKVSIEDLITAAKKEYEVLKNSDLTLIQEYIVTLVDMLNNNLGYISPRRATMFQDSLLAVHASRLAINNITKEEQEVSILDSAVLSLLNSCPLTANQKIDRLRLTQFAKEAFKLSQMANSPMRKIIQEKDPIEKVILAYENIDEIPIEDMSKLTSSAFSLLDKQKRRAFALVFYLAFRQFPSIPASTMELLTNEIQPVFEVGTQNTMETLPTVAIYQDISIYLKQVELKEPFITYLSNLLNSFLPDGYSNSEEMNSLGEFFIHLAKEIHLW